MVNKRLRFPARHVVDSVNLSIIGGILVFWGLSYIDQQSLTIQGSIENHRNLTICIGAVILFLIGWQWPKVVLSSIKGIIYFPYHWGLAIRSFVGLFVVYICWVTIYEERFIISDLLICLLILVLTGVIIWIVATISTSLKSEHPIQEIPEDDRPIESLDENKFPEYEVTARDILTRLVGDGQDQACGNVSLIGSYGSGKTSICNLVRNIFENEKHSSKVLFCRYEAWQYLDDNAAIVSLINTVVDSISGVADVPELWNLPDRYVEALKEGGTWGRCLAALCGSHILPEDILGRIGVVLERLNWHVVIFIDDLDRIEGEQTECHRAIIRALNQLQKVPHIRYVICVGGMGEAEKQGGSDLLKLTRYQEWVPRIAPEMLSKHLRDERDIVLSEKDYIFLWSYIEIPSDDPLLWNRLLWQMETRSYLSWLVDLVDTPRALKTVLRETKAKWKHLKGELNWYDLLLISALKSAEGRLYEWILREPGYFTDKPLGLSVSKDKIEEEQKQQKAERQTRLNSLLSRKDPRRFSVAEDVLKSLFPVFQSHFSEFSASRAEYDKWRQNISLVPAYGDRYIRRYINGCIPKGEVPDQPTLRFIQRIFETGFQREEFENLYLLSCDKTTNDLNRFIQFSGLISRQVKLQVCDTILDWICDQNHWDVWSPQADPDYAGSLVLDIDRILSQTENIPRRIRLNTFANDTLDDEHSNSTEGWIKRRIPEIVGKSLVVGIRFVQYLREEFLPKRERNQIFSTAVIDVYVRSNRKIWPEIRNTKDCLSVVINSMINREGYGETERSQFTQKIISEVNLPESESLWEMLVVSLVSCTYPAASPEKIEHYIFSIDKSFHNRACDMEKLLPVIKGFGRRTFSSPLAKRAYQEIAQAYEF